MFQVAFRSIAPRGGVGQGGMQMFVGWSEMDRAGRRKCCSFFVLFLAIFVWIASADCKYIIVGSILTMYTVWVVDLDTGGKVLSIVKLSGDCDLYESWTT